MKTYTFIIYSIFLYGITEAHDQQLLISGKQDAKSINHQHEIEKQRKAILSAPAEILRMLMFMQMKSNEKYIDNSLLSAEKIYEIFIYVQSIPLNQKIPQLYKEYFLECYMLGSISYDRLKKQDDEKQQRIPEKFTDDLNKILHQDKYKSILPILLADQYFQSLSFSYAIKTASKDKDLNWEDILNQCSICYIKLILDEDFYRDFVSANQDLVDYTKDALKEYSSSMLKQWR